VPLTLSRCGEPLRRFTTEAGNSKLPSAVGIDRLQFGRRLLARMPHRPTNPRSLGKNAGAGAGLSSELQPRCARRLISLPRATAVGQTATACATECTLQSAAYCFGRERRAQAPSVSRQRWCNPGRLAGVMARQGKESLVRVPLRTPFARRQLRSDCEERRGHRLRSMCAKQLSVVCRDVILGGNYHLQTQDRP
jgi:hypothetical protein